MFDNSVQINLNPWISCVPTNKYILDDRFANIFKFPKIKYHSLNTNEYSLREMIDNLYDAELYSVAELINYKNIVSLAKTQLLTETENKTDIIPNSFINIYSEHLFNCILAIKQNKPKKKYIDIENIIYEKNIVLNTPYRVKQWLSKNPNITWDQLATASNRNLATDAAKSISIDADIKAFIIKNYNKNIPINEHTIINNSHLHNILVEQKDYLQKNYEKYMKCKNIHKIHSSLFNIVVIIYAIQTQHYYHITTKGNYLNKLVKGHEHISDNIIKYLDSSKATAEYINENILHDGIKMNIKFIDSDNSILEIKNSNISLKHIIYTTICHIIYNENQNQNKPIEFKYLNLLKGSITSYNFTLDNDKHECIKNYFSNRIVKQN
jgi:hypothetical protein